MALVDAVTGVRKAARKVIDTAIARGTMVAALEGDFYLRMRDAVSAKTRDAMRFVSSGKDRRP